MLTDQEKLAFVESTLQPMAQHTKCCVTQVVGVIDEKTGEHRGTGIYCKIDGREAIVAAAHVLKTAAATKRFVSLAFGRGSGEAPTIVAGRIIYSDLLDLAVYLPERPFPIGQSSDFWPENRIDRDNQKISRDYLFVHGFPCRFSRFTTLMGNSLISESLAFGAMLRPRESDLTVEERQQYERENPDYPLLPNDFLEPHQFALNFDVEGATFLAHDGSPDNLRTSIIKDWSELFQGDPNSEQENTLPGQKSRGAYGLSGSPVWRIGGAGRPIKNWAPDWSQLVGVVTAWNEPLRVLIATFASKIYDVVR